MSPPADRVDALAADLRAWGIDITLPLAVDSALCGLFPFERFGRVRALGVLIGNTRALWPALEGWLQVRGTIVENPVDTFVEEHLARALEEVFGSCRRVVYLSRRRDYDLGEPQQGETDRGAVPMQRVLQTVGFAALAPVHLSVHPRFGSWFSPRAIVCLDAAGGSNPPPRLEPCGSCPGPCREPFRQAMARRAAESAAEAIKTDWRAWLRVRQACPVGLEYQYSIEQSEYHYRHDPGLLAKVRS